MHTPPPHFLNASYVPDCSISASNDFQSSFHAGNLSMLSKLNVVHIHDIFLCKARRKNVLSQSAYLFTLSNYQSNHAKYNRK